MTTYNTFETYIMDGVLSKAGPPNSSGYLNIRKKYRCPISIPTNSIIPLKKKKINK
jgi:hypothetical protein